MNTLTAPRPQEQEFHPDNLANEKVIPQDPWAEIPQAPGDHSGNLAPLPHMSPQEEAKAFDGIVQEFVETRVVDQLDDAQGTPTPAKTEEAQYTPRHLRLSEQPFTPTPISDIEPRNKANLEATLTLRETLRNVEPELLQEAKNAMPGPVTEQIILPTTEQPAQQPAEQLGVQTAESERSANYRSRHRLLGRFARLFGR